MLERYTEYDELAWFYDRYWGREYPQRALPILDRLLLTHLPQNARILDVCCGVGHLTKLLADRGYRLFGLDRSAEMLHYALHNVPGAALIVADARSFRLLPKFDAAISTFESLNHFQTSEELKDVLGNIHAALKNGGYLVFDLLLEEAYRTQWNQHSILVEDDRACMVRGSYDSTRRLGRADITLFRKNDEWRRSDITIFERCYELGEVWTLLEQAGYNEISFFDARQRLGMPGSLGVGRVFFVVKKGGE